MKTKRMAAIALTAVVALSATSLVACGDSTDYANDPTTWQSLESGNNVVITFAGRDVSTEETNYRNFINKFNQTNQYNISVKIVWKDTGTYNTYLEGCGKNLPDVFMMTNERFIAYASAGKLADIKDHITEGTLDDLYEKGYEVYYFNDTAKTVGKSEGASLYGLPKDQGPVALCYNVELLTQTVNAYNATAAGTAAPLDINTITSTTEPMKFDYFLDVGKKLRSVLDTSKYVCAGYDLESIVYSNNANFFTDDTATTSAITSQNFIDAIQFIQDMYTNNILPSSDLTVGEDEFKSGDAIFYYAQPFKTKDYWADISKFSWDILPVLCGNAEGAVSTAYVGGMCYAISAQSKYKDAALKLVEYLSTNKTSQRQQYSLGQCIPNLKSLADEYRTNSEDLIGEESNGNTSPANRSVWIDAINGTSATDKITGKYTALSFTLQKNWMSSLKEWLSGKTSHQTSVWKGGNVSAVLNSYNSTFQSTLDNYQRLLHR